ncbi:methyltransferase [Saccharothrix sp. ALI-22-I]|uniref:O-methyltransferase n=1 Tax=Saccharothrix sp. ALI-22-I TaxID=1933778 RepID=UPI00097C242C|nr:O-methyltransferase [Saccharothrix sp. ALI-22-I]ONI86103.1 methyltransferase [Saccharothrix sp. ALI-22-I]
MDAPTREYVERYLPEDAVVKAARARGAELGCVPIGSGGGAALRFLAAALQAKAVVEIGTGAGVGALYLLGGMPATGVLTSIDVAPEHQRAARVAFAEAGIAVSRTRLIMGRALEVLPRLTDGAYDLVFVDAAKSEYPKYLEEGVRLLRPGGVIAFDNVLWHGRVVDPSQRDPDTVAMREVARAVRDDDRLVAVILPLGDGLLVAAKTA